MHQKSCCKTARHCIQNCPAGLLLRFEVSIRKDVDKCASSPGHVQGADAVLVGMRLPEFNALVAIVEAKKSVEVLEACE